MSKSLRCIHCRAVWTSSDAVPAGEQVECPECRRHFAAPDTAMKSSPPPLAAKSRHDDEDDDSFPVGIKKRRRPQRSRLALWLVLLGGGGVFALLVCAGVGTGAYFLFFTGPKITGQWDLVEPQVGGRVAIDFRADGTGMIDGPAADVHFTYKLKTDDPMTLEWRITRIEPKRQMPVGLMGRFPVGPMWRLPMMANNQNLVGAIERFRVNLKVDTMTLTNQNDGVVLTLRKVR